MQDLNKYHIIFMDNQMPVLGGVDATKKLREGGYQHLIVGLTGYVLQEDVTEYLMAGADLILSKPLRMDVLDMLLTHVRANGYLSKPGMFLVIDSNSKTLNWISESINKV
mmetsp:Transcript_2069/g.2825  ORF Transcript_2069/g.2825 Transcript_2069/m.2825 type:complete len:110 (+) Transcript_2069:694-1023(+)